MGRHARSLLSGRAQSTSTVTVTITVTVTVTARRRSVAPGLTCNR